ncbi:VC0807 family protein [Nocardia sp. 2YAB30]|uniref:VC0807 family protein n=1 Tax=Nocardia sp. 2YAB30 TaxID=3233022 RepID=UPI003F9C2DFC
MNQPQARAVDPTPQQKRAIVRRHVLQQLATELVLPLGGYYVLRAAGLSPWLALVVPALLVAALLGYYGIRRRRLEVVALFTLLAMVAGTAMTLVTGDPRALMVRDSWITGLFGVWILATRHTQQPFVRMTSRAIVTAKVGAQGYRQWDARWDADPEFRRHLRLLSGVWGLVFTVDVPVRVLLASTLPIDAIPLASTLQWVVAVAACVAFQSVYVTKHGLKV